MERITFRLRLKPGMKELYKKRHDEIWPEMLEVLDRTGIRNYTIWCSGEDLFGYYEVEDPNYSNEILSSDPVVAKWNDSMKDIYETVIDEKTGTHITMDLMFSYKINN